MNQPFDKHDAAIRRVAMKFLASPHSDYPPATPELEDTANRVPSKFYLHVGPRYLSVSPYIEQAVALADEAAAWFQAGSPVVVTNFLGGPVYSTTSHHECGKGDLCPQTMVPYIPSFGATAGERVMGLPNYDDMGSSERRDLFSTALKYANLDRSRAFADKQKRWLGGGKGYRHTPSSGVILGHPDQRPGCTLNVYLDERDYGIPNNHRGR